MDEELLRALETVMDPELGVDVVSLGLVYGAKREGDTAHVVMTMTTPACPLGESIAAEARAALLAGVPGLRHVDIELVFEPAWSPDRMSPRARAQLGVPEPGAP
ncbi:MAG: metal-sulfur cluster assembly factor [Myxococcota bacterium]